MKGSGVPNFKLHNSLRVTLNLPAKLISFSVCLTENWHVWCCMIQAIFLETHLEICDRTVRAENPLTVFLIPCVYAQTWFCLNKLIAEVEMELKNDANDIHLGREPCWNGQVIRSTALVKHAPGTLVHSLSYHINRISCPIHTSNHPPSCIILIRFSSEYSSGRSSYVLKATISKFINLWIRVIHWPMYPCKNILSYYLYCL